MYTHKSLMKSLKIRHREGNRGFPGLIWDFYVFVYLTAFNICRVYVYRHIHITVNSLKQDLNKTKRSHWWNICYLGTVVF